LDAGGQGEGLGEVEEDDEDEEEEDEETVLFLIEFISKSALFARPLAASPAAGDLLSFK
jgi:hypothetical protein